MPDRAPSTLPQELISFYLGDQHFCIDIMAVREIRGWKTATPLPHAPASSRGVINLRGTILPIVDLSKQLGLPSTEPTKQNVVIVVQSHDQAVGLLVDGVNGILTVTPDMMQAVPPIAVGAANTQVDGLIEIDERLLTLLNLHELVAAQSQAA